MNEKITAIILILIVISSMFILFSWFNQTSTELTEGQTEGESTDEILSEIDEALLVEDSEIEIGEMI